MQAYRRLASTATSSTSRSASHASHAHAHPHASHTHTHTQGQSSRLSRSSSSIASVSSSSSIASTTTVNNLNNLNLTMTAPTDYPAYSYTSRSPTSPTKGGLSLGVSRSSMAASHFGSEPPRPSRAEIQTIAEGLLAHVNFGPYHLASSPATTVSSIHTHLGHGKSASTSAANSSTFFLAGPSSRRAFAESAERGRGGRNATVASTASASGRGRGGRTKGLSLGVVDESSTHDEMDDLDIDFDFSLEDGERRGRRGRDREGRGRDVQVKGLRCLS